MEKPLRLLVLIDFSDYSDTLIDLAFQFAKQWHCKVIFVHQVPGLVPLMTESHTKKAILYAEIDEARQKLKTLVQSRYSFADAEYLVTEYDLLHTIKKQDQTEYDHWVMTGLKGTGTFKQLFIGSTTTRLVDESNLPIITLPLSREIVMPKNLICAISYKHPVNMNALQQMLHKLQPWVESVQLVTIIDNDDKEDEASQYLKAMEQIFANFKPHTHVLKGAEPLQLLKDMVEEKSSTYLMIQQGSRNLSDVFFRKFMVNELVYHGSIPLLIIPL